MIDFVDVKLQTAAIILARELNYMGLIPPG
jgi:hypothetical protein